MAWMLIHISADDALPEIALTDMELQSLSVHVAQELTRQGDSASEFLRNAWSKLQPAVKESMGVS